MNSSGKSFGKFLILWSGQLISAIGSGLTSFGLGIYVFQQTGKASEMALVTLLAFMPSLLLSAFSGVLADRYDRRLLMVLGDSLYAIGLVYILICMLQGDAQLWQICVGVTISSVFASLLDPAYKATVTDLLTEEQYTKANGLASNKYEQAKSFIREFKDGWGAVYENRGVFVLVIMTSVLTFFLGVIETLSIPMILAFSNTSVVGTLETIIASGMLVSSVMIGILPIKKGYLKILSVSLFCIGIFMAGFGLRENIILISISGFLFFVMLPFANVSLDFLVRTNIDNSVQGRAWAFIGIISQLGFVTAYAISGVLADYVFTPLLVDGGVLADSVGKIIGTGIGRGTGFLIIIAGMLLCVTSIILYNLKSIKKLENGGDLCISE